jgi:peptidyl-prolyl cis-trans isomerase SurA
MARVRSKAAIAALLWLGVLASVVVPEGGAALVPQRIAAVVNDDVVSFQDLDERLQLVAVTSGIGDSEEARERLAPQVLRQLIEETLQLQEAERLEITVSQSEIDQALANIAQRNNLTVEELRQFLASSNVKLETLLEQIRAQIAWVKIVNREIRPRVNVTVDQLELAVQDARRNRGQPEFMLSEIVLPVDSPEQNEAVARDAERLVQTVREGADFGSLARQVSVAASAERGGELGWVPAAQIPPELLAELEGLQPGDVSEPIRSPIGYHIFWLRDRRLAAAEPPAGAEDVQVRLTQILFPAEDGAGAAMVDEMRTRAEEMRGGLNDCPSMVRAAEEIGAPSSGELGWLRIGDLPPQLGQAVLSLPVGEVSPPLRGPAGVHLLMVCERREPGGSGQPEEDASTREDIAQRLEGERIERLARRYLRDLRKQAFVEVRL